MNAESYITIYAEKAATAAAKAAITTDARDKDFLLREARRYTNLSNGARESAQRDAAQVEAAQPVAVVAPAAKVEAKKEAAKPAKVRCPHYKAIRTFFAVANEAGLDVKNKKGMRSAFSVLLGKTITSRADLDGQAYSRATAEVRSGAMWW